VITRTGVAGVLQVSVFFDVSGVPDREVPYTRTGQLYRPDAITVKLISNPRDGSVPRREDLRVDDVIIYGGKLKGDGTPGKAIATERLYFAREYPGWMQGLTDSVLTELKEAA
jgi:hypothetical protein